MRSLACLVLVACGNSDPQQPAPDARSCPPPIEGLPLCEQSCGNHIAEACQRYVAGSETANGCGHYEKQQEACDGTDFMKSCQDLGYYGGTVTCKTMCAINEDDCVACASNPRTVSCGPAGWYSLNALEPTATGTSLGALGQVLFGPSEFTIFTQDAMGLYAGATTPLSPYVALTGDGWLAVAQGANQIQHVDTNAVITTQMLWGDTGDDATVTYGPSDRALVAWNKLSPVAPRMFIAVVTGAGSIVTAPHVPQALLAADDHFVSSTSDGMSFFVATRLGVLHRFAADGTWLSSAVGFPAGEISIAWGATFGWFIARTSGSLTRYTVRRFDAAGTALGTPFVIDDVGNSLVPLTAVGDELMGLRSTSLTTSVNKLELVRFDATGTATSLGEVGVGRGVPDGLERFGANVALGWLGANHVQLALVAP